jgi:hypothetical protein
MLQEQHRNPVICRFMSETILYAEENTRTVIDILKEVGVVRRDTDPDFWMKIVSCLFYTFSGRMMLGIGDSSPDFTGMGMSELLRTTFDLMLEVCGVKNNDGLPNPDCS